MGHRRLPDGHNMSNLSWQPTFLYLTDGAGIVPESYELVQLSDQLVTPLAVITRHSTHKWELVYWERTGQDGFSYNRRISTQFKSLKQAKAFGLAIIRFEQAAKP